MTASSPAATMHRPHAMWADKPMPGGERRLLTTLSAGVWMIALAMNVSHVYDHLGQSDIRIDDTRRAVLCLAPDVLLLIGVWKLRYRARSAVAWAMVGTGLAWLGWSALSTAHGTLSAGLLAVAPIGVAVLTTLALEFKPAPEPAVAVAGGAVTDLRAVSEDHQPVSELVEAVPAVAPPAPRKTAPKVDAKRPAPSREQARVILLALDSMDAKTNADLAREHGGTPEFWGQRKKALRGELADLTTEAGTL